MNWPCLIPKLFWKYDLMLTKIRDLENQHFLSCEAAAVVAEVEEAAAAGSYV